MPQIRIEQAHSLPHAEVKARLLTVADRLAAKYGIAAHWTSEREAEIKCTGVKGKITCTDGHVEVTLDLGFLLAPLKSKIEERIRSELATALVSPSSEA